jgi:hypothetical protein
VISTEDWTYGCEHELVDWHRERGIPLGFGLDLKDYTMVNSCGVAVDPKGLVFHLGGELNTPPTHTPDGQAEHLATFLAMHPEARVNYRSNLHVHVKVPAIEHDLAALKRVSAYCFKHLREVFALIEPIPMPQRRDYSASDEMNGAMKRYRRRHKSHQTILTADRQRAQMGAETPEEFFAAECPRSHEGKPQWHLTQRCAVNLRHLREDVPTIEFRHFPGTLRPSVVKTCVSWCRDFLVAALEDRPIVALLAEHANSEFPKFEPYQHRLEQGWRKTCHNGVLSRDQVEANIKEILACTS